MDDHHQQGQGEPGCGGDICLADTLRQRARLHRHRGVGVDRVRRHVEHLLAAGMTRTDIAVAANLDRTTVGRLLRPDVHNVERGTARRLLAVDVPVG